VAGWAKANNVSTNTISPNEEWISFSVPISKANQLFDAQYSTFTHVESGKQIIRTLSFSLPSELLEHVTTALPTTGFTDPNVRLMTPEIRWTRRQMEKRQRGLSPACNSTINPACLEALYQIPVVPAINKKNSLLVTGYIGQFANMADLKVPV
jgi:tripeptidyl-peptidase I